VAAAEVHVAGSLLLLRTGEMTGAAIRFPSCDDGSVRQSRLWL